MRSPRDSFSTPAPPLGVVHRSNPLNVYWAARVEDLESLTTIGPKPQNFVTAQPHWLAVDAAVRSSDMASLASLDPTSPAIGKLLAEAVYEQVRQRVQPEAPSRLSCLFATLSAMDAISFAGEHTPSPIFDAPGFPLSGPTSVPASTGQGAWIALDMHAFQACSVSGDSAAVEQLVTGLRHAAERYWRGATTSQPFVEVLSEGLVVDGWPARS